MKVSLNQDANIISLPDNFAQLQKINNSGVFFYSFFYNLDVALAQKSSAFLVKITVYKNAPERNKASIFDDGFDGESIINKLLIQSQVQKDIRRSGLIIKEKFSDATKKIPNNFKEIQKNETTLNDKIPVRTTLTVTPKTASSLSNGNVVAPVLETNLNVRNSNELIGLQTTNKTTKKLSFDLIYRNKQDPANMIGQKSYSVVPSSKVLGGVISKQTKTTPKNNFSQKNNSTQIDKTINQLTNNFFTSITVDNHTELNKTQMVNAVEREQFTYVTVGESFYLNNLEIGNDDFIIEFTLLNEKRFPVQIIEKLVSHTDNVSKILIPSVQPTMVVEPLGSGGRNIIRLKQNDEYATSIALFRKIVSTNQNAISSNYFNIKNIPLAKINGEVIINDIIATSNPIIYRAVAVNSYGQLSGEFASQVISGKNYRAKNIKGSLSKRQNNLTLTHEIENKRIKLQITNIVSSAVSFKLLKKNISLHEKNYSIIGIPVLLNINSNAPIVLEDSDIKENRIYEYAVQLIYQDGTEEIANNTLIVEYTPVVNNIVNVDISLPVVSSEGNTIDVSFEVAKNIISTEIDLVKALLGQQDLLTEFQDEVTANREKLQNLFFIRVLRTNMLTGQIEDFGVINDTTFSDRTFGTVKNVSALESGIAYKYSVITYARSAETLFETLTRTVETSNGSYTLTPSKFLHPITLQKGNLVSKDTITKNYANSEFTLGTVVDIKYVNVDLTNVLPTITDVKSSIISNNKILLRWKIVGDANRIDHFIISLDVLGMRTIVGKCHNITENNEFNFIDMLDNGESGTLEYVVTPVFFDYTQGTEVKSNQIVF